MSGMTWAGVELAYVDVLHDTLDGRKLRTSERTLGQQLLGVGAVQCGDTTSQPAARREGFPRPAELEPEPM
jgi:hypothetical protein